MSTTAERFIAAQEALLDALGVDDDGGTFARASERLDEAFEALRSGPRPEERHMSRMQSLGALLDRGLEQRRAGLTRELGRTRLALDLVRKRSMGARPGRKFDVSG
ncbi:MAG: hypothetical protein ACYSWX_01130 [Planctomycetota bacterium]